MPASVTIVTCTRDPRDDLFARVLAAVSGLVVPPGAARDHLIVDSGSTPPLATRAPVAEYLARTPWARLLRCEEHGVAAARRMAVAESSGELILWIDDDNVPQRDYLEGVIAIATRYPAVTVWGAGRIRVEFVDPVPSWVDPWLRPTFQEREHPSDEFGRSTAWAPYFPVGSGMVGRRAALERWAHGRHEGRYSLTGRAGRSLSAGEDAEMIFGAVASGEQVGVTSRQQLTHLIPASRCTMSYLRRLEHGLASSVRVARAECFSDDPSPASRAGLGVWRTLRAVVSRWRHVGWREAALEWSRRAGARAGAREAARLSRR